MRLEHLTTDEILRTQQPQTELEKVLFDRVEDVEERAVEAETEARIWQDQSCGACDDKETEISELSDEVIALRKLLDKHEIDHSDI